MEDEFDRLNQWVPEAPELNQYLADVRRLLTRTWRGLYDLNGLAGDITYNTNAGSEILLYYLSRVAIVKKEDQQRGGHLARATYSAYNGGPRQVGRYRNPETTPSLRRVDEAFWTKFQRVSAGQELEVKSCYGR